MPGEVWQAIAAIAIAVASALGGRATARQSTKAAEITTSPDNVRADTERIESLWKRVDALEADNRAMRDELEQMKSAAATSRYQIRAHIPWDEQAIAAARRAGVIIGDPPPLTA